MKILVGTSGDTGPAAAHSVANLERVDLVLIYPLNRVSKYQELQMLTVTSPNVHVCSGKKLIDYYSHQNESNIFFKL